MSRSGLEAFNEICVGRLEIRGLGSEYKVHGQELKVEGSKPTETQDSKKVLTGSHQAWTRGAGKLKPLKFALTTLDDLEFQGTWNIFSGSNLT